MNGSFNIIANITFKSDTQLGKKYSTALRERGAIANSEWNIH